MFRISQIKCYLKTNILSILNKKYERNQNYLNFK